jgi:hypothetical protein
MATKADDAHKHALQLMGHLIPAGTKRDAVHIAVAPVVSDNSGYLSPARVACIKLLRNASRRRSRIVHDV